MWDVKAIKILEILPIEKADSIETAMIGGWPCVVRKGQYKPSDLVCYVPVDSIVPEDVLDSVGLKGKLGGSNKNRVKAVRLRGQLSIGILLPVPPGFSEGDSLANFYNITKWEEPVPPQLAGKCRKHPRFWLKYDIDNINNDLSMFTEGEEIIALTKIHGTHVSFCLEGEDFSVSSRGVTLLEEDGNLYWDTAKAFDIKRKMLDAIKGVYNPGNLPIYLHGEIFGPVQDLNYGRNIPDLACFDLRVGNLWLDWDSFAKICDQNLIPKVPIDWRGPYSLNKVKELASAPNILGGTHMKEGTVIRPIVESFNIQSGNRKIAKIINPEYLLRKNAKELH